MLAQHTLAHSWEILDLSLAAELPEAGFAGHFEAIAGFPSSFSQALEDMETAQHQLAHLLALPGHGLSV